MHGVKVHCLVQELVDGKREIEKTAEPEVRGSGRNSPGERQGGLDRPSSNRQKLAVKLVTSVCFDKYRSIV